MLFVIVAKDKPNSLALRSASRQAHLEYAKTTGVVRLAGPLLNEKDEMIGSLLIIESASLDAAKAWQSNDPYVKAGLFQSAELHPWKAAVNLCNAAL